jgi:S1-C subfamily serine protease
MLPGDVVTMVGGQSIATVTELLGRVSGLKPGVSTDFGVSRRGQTLVLKITPGLRPKPKPVGIR